MSQALQLVELAERALVSAVIYERERGTSWADIARYLGIDPSGAEARFAAALTLWDTAFEVPYRLDDTGLVMAAPEEENSQSAARLGPVMRHHARGEIARLLIVSE